MLKLESPGIFGSKLDAPQTDRLLADCDAALSKQVFDISLGKVKSIVKPDGRAEDIRREPRSLICVQGPILPISAC